MLKVSFHDDMQPFLLYTTVYYCQAHSCTKAPGCFLLAPSDAVPRNPGPLNSSSPTSSPGALTDSRHRHILDPPSPSGLFPVHCVRPLLSRTCKGNGVCLWGDYGDKPLRFSSEEAAPAKQPQQLPVSPACSSCVRRLHCSLLP